MDFLSLFFYFNLFIQDYNSNLYVYSPIMFLCNLDNQLALQEWRVHYDVS